MDLQKLSYLVALADSGSFSEAAERLFTTQSSVTKKIQALEDELGINLVDRSKRKISITEAGEVVVKHARELLAVYHSMMQDVSGRGLDQTGEVRIAAIPTMAHYQIPKYLAEFRKLFPDITLTVQEVESSLAPGELEVMNYDLGFLRSDALDPAQFKKIVLSVDPLVVILPSTHPLAGHERVGLRDLAGDNFLQLGKTSILHGMVIKACERAGFTPKLQFCGKYQENIVSMVENNMGVSVMVRRTAEHLKTEHVVILPLEEEFTSELSLVRLRKRVLPPAANLFWEYIHNIHTAYEKVL